MKNPISKILLFLLFFTVSFGGAFLEYINAKSDGENITIEWKTGKEESVKVFSVERKTPQGGFVEIGTVVPKGNNSFYTFTDKSAYKSNSMVFIYKLRIIDNNQQSTYSSEVSVSHNISGVKRTWGSIKAMFR